MSTELEDQLSDQLKQTVLRPPVDRISAAEIEALAQSRSRHRVRLTTVAAAVVVSVAAASSVALVRHYDDNHASLTDQAIQHLAGRHRPPKAGGTDPGSVGSARPMCGGAWINVVSVDGGTLVSPPDDYEEPVITATVGTPLLITSGIGPDGDKSYVHTLQFVVTPPGTEPAAPGPAEDPENQLAASTVIGGFVSDDQTVQLTWTPTEKGRFPMIGLVSESMSDDCTSPDPDGMVMSGEDPLAVIVVE